MENSETGRNVSGNVRI